MTVQNETGWVAVRAAKIAQWPKLLRIITTVAFAIEMTVTLFVVLALILDSVDSITTVMWVSVIVGMVLYVVGWWAMVGFDSNQQSTWKAGPPAVWVYVLALIGFVLMVLAVVVAILNVA